MAAALHTFESKDRKPDQTAPWVGAAFLAWLAGLAICLLTVVIGASGATYYAVLFGVATLIAAADNLAF